ncbi:HK97-gp10 family putative phage morphogenesis protein [Castellaniella hirudinis]|uniref:HK97-gp10 family putative phage morphogenesis protein n=1 Tax=Castellaniella hirudinis TaxID=1144617 RepID=UPI0039C0AE81
MATSLNAFKGGAELQKFLDTLPAKVERNIMRSALRQGANAIKKAAQENVRNVSGDLAKSVRVSGSAKGGQVAASVKVNAFYAHMVEFGTAQHFIKVSEEAKPTRKTRRGPKKVSVGTVNKMVARGSLVIDGRFAGASVLHPGAAPKPFMRPAVDEKTGEAIQAIGNQIRKRLTKEGISTPDAPEVGDQ